jgi:glycerophosphoryl diester phosphodiesterase
VLELDVRVCRAGGMLCVHDPLPEDGIAGPGPPALEDVLDRYGAGTRYLVDLKDPDPAWERRVVDAIARRGLERRAMIQSFDVSALARLHDAARWLAIAALYRRAGSVGLDVAAIPPFARAVGVHHPNVDAAFVARAHARGLAVHPWTVDDAAEAQRLVALGVDGVITNLPDVVAPVVRPAALAA